MKRKTVLQHPAVNDEWRDAFRNTSMRVGFFLSLSKAMLEMLCAVADDVTWDRGIFRTMHFPDNWIASEHSLVKRGLIRRKEWEATKLSNKDWEDGKQNERSFCELTPAGEKVVELLKLAGLFVEQDAAITKKFRAKK